MKICPKCSAEHNKPGTFCSRKCANSRGPRDENFKEKLRQKLTGSKLSPKHLASLPRGDNHHKRKNKNLEPLVDTVCEFCKIKVFKYGKSKFCSKTCWMEHNKSLRSAWDNYKFTCKFTFNVFDYPNYFDLSLINEYGWYTASNRGNNLNGISRDHMISVRYGFENSIDPKIIAHPANCLLVRHKENQSKRTKCSLTLEQLLERIKIFESHWQSGDVSDCKSEELGSIPR